MNEEAKVILIDIETDLDFITVLLARAYGHYARLTTDEVDHLEHALEEVDAMLTSITRRVDDALCE